MSSRPCGNISSMIANLSGTSKTGSHFTIHSRRIGSEFSSTRDLKTRSSGPMTCGTLSVLCWEQPAYRTLGAGNNAYLIQSEGTVEETVAKLATFQTRAGTPAPTLCCSNKILFKAHCAPFSNWCQFGRPRSFPLSPRPRDLRSLQCVRYRASPIVPMYGITLITGARLSPVEPFGVVHGRRNPE